MPFKPQSLFSLQCSLSSVLGEASPDTLDNIWRISTRPSVPTCIYASAALPHQSGVERGEPRAVILSTRACSRRARICFRSAALALA